MRHSAKVEGLISLYMIVYNCSAQQAVRLLVKEGCISKLCSWIPLTPIEAGYVCEQRGIV